MDITKKAIYVLSDKLSGMVFAVSTNVGWMVEYRNHHKETNLIRVEVGLEEWNQVLLNDPSMAVSILTAEVIDREELERQERLARHDTERTMAAVSHRQLIEETTIDLKDNRLEVDESLLEVPKAPKK